MRTTFFKKKEKVFTNLSYFPMHITEITNNFIQKTTEFRKCNISETSLRINMKRKKKGLRISEACCTDPFTWRY